MFAIRWMRRAVAVAGLAGLIAAPPSRTCLGDEDNPSRDDVASAAVKQALATTLSSGRPTLIVQTASASAVTPGFYRQLVATPAIVDLGRTLQVVEAPTDDAPALVRALGLSPEPGFYFVRRNGKTLELASRSAGLEDAEEAGKWLRTQLDLATKGDPALAKSGLFHRDTAAAASPQAEPPAPGWTPPPQAPVLLQAAPQVVTAPVVVQSPAPSIVFQQQAPQIYLAPPTTPPTVNILSAAPAAPAQILMGPAQPAAQSGSVPVQMPMTMMAAPAPAPCPAPAMAAAPLVAIPPSLFGRMIGNFGERLMRHKYPRVAGAVATTQLSQTVTTPVTLAPQAVVAIPAQPQGPPPAAPSPQAETEHHGLFNFLKR